MPPPQSSRKPNKARSDAAAKPVRLRSVLLGSVMASAVALTLGIAGAIGLWYGKQRPDRSNVDSQSSLESVAGRVLTDARDLGEFVRHSVTRDLSRAVSLLRAAKGGAERAETPDTPQTAPSVGRTRGVTSGDGSPSRPPRHAGPTLKTEIAPPTVSVPLEPPLHLIFDRRDSNVTPPLMHHVRLRSAPPLGRPSGNAAAETGVVEVVVSVSGTVESAKFLTRPLDVHEAMLLSAVKAWRFRPAMRNGQAIRYRLTVPIGRARI